MNRYPRGAPCACALAPSNAIAASVNDAFTTIPQNLILIFLIRRGQLPSRARRDIVVHGWRTRRITRVSATVTRASLCASRKLDSRARTPLLLTHNTNTGGSVHMMAGGTARQALAAAIALAAVACGGEKEAPKVAKGPVIDSTAPARTATTNGFKEPESVRYDSVNDVFYVSNINGSPLGKDNNGFISRMKSDGTIDSLELVAGGRGGVTLNAPKGLALIGDTLWVADIDAVRAFNVHTGAAVATVDLSPFHALFLNDICVGGDGA